MCLQKKSKILPQGSLNNDYTRKDAFLIGTTLTDIEAKNIKISDIFYFLNDSTTNRECLNYI